MTETKEKIRISKERISEIESSLPQLRDKIMVAIYKLLKEGDGNSEDVLQKIGSAINELPETERQVIDGVYLHKKTPLDVGNPVLHNYKISKIRDFCDSGIDKIADTLGLSHELTEKILIFFGIFIELRENDI